MKLKPNVIDQYPNMENLKVFADDLSGLAIMNNQLTDVRIMESLKIAGVTSLLTGTSYTDYPFEEYRRKRSNSMLHFYDHIREAIKKIEALEALIQEKVSPDAYGQCPRQGPKTSYMVFRNQKYTTIKTENIAFFYIKNNYTFLTCFDKQEYMLNQSLDQIACTASPSDFFRINRQYLVNFSAIKEVEHYMARKLHVKLVVDAPDKLLINKEKTHSFLEWMDAR
ncbi:LytTR family DNA-binding domain-containing protein [Chitinophaga sp. S165]|uniref:LytR/AlgR family response regulator transcription factor n=1 Tax=Chitinophaga sp. S165 TaxID=2135462 RepID=UPI000D9A9A65|nr:response regulator transcription factor [Chitinophaga sp. S165]PWV47727.1 LytTr DNA-binding domain-containing protein [Chitinophaga sp. S165]